MVCPGIARHRKALPVLPGQELRRSEEHTSELQSQHLISYAVFCLKKIFFNDTATTEIYTLSLHDALPISASGRMRRHGEGGRRRGGAQAAGGPSVGEERRRWEVERRRDEDGKIGCAANFKCPRSRHI